MEKGEKMEGGWMEGWEGRKWTTEGYGGKVPGGWSRKDGERMDKCWRVDGE